MGIFDFFRRKKEEEKKEMDIKSLALLKINKLKKGDFSEKKFDEFVFIFRVFLMNKLKLSGQKTHEELLLELEKRKTNEKLKNKIIVLSSEINKIEFENGRIGKEKFNRLIFNLEEIIKII